MRAHGIVSLLPLVAALMAGCSTMPAPILGPTSRYTEAEAIADADAWMAGHPERIWRGSGKGWSMLPVIGDNAICLYEIAPTDLRAGDFATYNLNGLTILHRIDFVGPKAARFSGINNMHEDAEPVPLDRVRLRLAGILFFKPREAAN